MARGVLLQHGNARLHTAHAKVATIQDLPFEYLPHPPYSPDLAPSDYHMFGPLKEELGGKKSCSDEEVQRAMCEWLCRQPKDFFPPRGVQGCSDGRVEKAA
jgi:histone-lysine N-methyltransferase SETMAR